MQRIFLTGLALIPALAAALPLSGISVAVSGLGSAYALVASLRPGPQRVGRTTQGARRATTLLRAPLSTAEKSKLPDQAELSLRLMRVLSSAHDFQPPGFPLDRNTAIARTLQGFLQGWKTQDLAKLSANQRAELFLIDTLLRAEPGEAGRIAQLFARPETMLDLRDEIDLIGLRRAAFDRDYTAYLATQALWELPEQGQSLLHLLQSLNGKDIDLWHHVVLHHDLADAGQRRAAFWCLAQPDCDRATVAGYLGRLVREDVFRNDDLRNDSEFLPNIQALIRAWNEGFYKHQELALTAPFKVTTLQPFFETETELLAKETPHTLPNPHCAFVSFEGRAPRKRDIWDLRHAQIIAPPHQDDYFEIAFAAF